MDCQQHTVLIVDASFEDRELYRRCLLHDPDSYTVLEAALGQQGLALWQQHQPDVVLLNCRLPDLDGLEFLNQLQASLSQSHLPVIVVTEQGNESAAVKTLQAGAQDYLLKEQTTPAKLRLAVERVIETTRLRTHLQQRIERERVVAQITQQVHQSLELDRILQTTVTEVRQFLNTDRVLFFQLQPDGYGTVVAESVGAEWTSLLACKIDDPCLVANYLKLNYLDAEPYSPAVAEDYIERYRQGQIKAISNIHDSNINPCHVELLAQFQVQANLVVPILHEDQFWGLLIAHHCATPRTWQSLEIDLLKELATQVGIALRQAELYQQAQKELAERKQVEAELRASEARLRSALNASRMGTWDWDIQTGKITWSDNLESMFGLEPGAFDGSYEMFASCIHPDDRDRVLSTIQHVVTTGEDYSIEFRVVYPNGHIRWALSQGKVFYGNGRPVRMAGNDIDITERKQIEETLRLQAQVLDQTHDSVVTTDLDGYITSWNNGAERMFGYKAEETLGQHVALLYAHEMQTFLSNEVIAPLKAKGEHEIEVVALRKSGEPINLLLSLSLLRDEQEKVIGMIGFSMDITERKQAEEQLRASEERLQMALDATQTGVWDWNLQTNEVIWSPQHERLLGYEPGTPYRTYQEWLERVHPEDIERVKATIQAAMVQRQGYRCEYRVIWADGSIHWLEALGKYVYGSDGGAIRMHGILFEITDRQQADQALRESEARFRTSVENMLDCFAIYSAVRNPQGEIVDFRTEYVNDAACRNNQMTREQQIGRGLCELLPGHRENGLFDEYCQVVETGQSLVKDSLIYEDDYGQQRLKRAFDIRVAKFGDGYIATWRDITERKRNEEALRRNEQLLRLALESAQAGSWDWEIRTGKIVWSPENFDLYGLAPTQALQYQDWDHTLHPDDRERAHAEVAHALEARLTEYRAEFRIVHPQRGIRWILALGRLTLDEAGAPVRISGINLDITDRKQAEEALQQSEAFNRRILESSNDCIKLLNLEGQILYMNPGGLCLLEIDDFTPYFNAVWTSLWQAENHSFIEAALAIAKTGEVSRFQGFAPTTKGTPKWWDVVITPILNPEGQVVQLLATSRDITERKQSEEALQESEERFRTLADNMSQFAWMAHANGDIFWYNQRWFDYTGTTLEEMQGWGWQKVHHPDHVDRVVHHIRHCFETGQSWEDTFPLRGQDRQYRWFLSRAIPIKDEQGQIVCWFGTNTDIDDRKQVEEALSQSEARYRCLAELIPQLVWTANPNGDLLDVNQRWLDFTGLTIEQAHAVGWKQIVHPDDAPLLAQQWAEAVRLGTPYQAQGRMRRADGVYYWHLHQAIPQRDEQGEIVKWFGTATDIETQKRLQSERDRLLQEEQAARESAERANRIKDEFLAVLSHELRSPLNPILGWAKLMQSRKFDAAKTMEALATIERNAKLQCQLIDDLLDVAKILRGKLSMEMAPVDLAFVVEAALDTVKAAAAAKNILLRPVLPLIGKVSGDLARLQQIVWNLLSNAIKFTPSGGQVEIQLSAVSSQQIEGAYLSQRTAGKSPIAQYAQITVRDTGKGINPDFLPHIFESFRQEDASTTRKYGGLGLGLAIVRHLVEAHGGTIWADSPGEGRGATFTVWLPLLDPIPERLQLEETVTQDLDLTGVRVLTVDDEPDARELLTAVLTQYGAEVLAVTSAAEVLINLESFQPDVLVSDIGMPEVNGYMLIQQVRSLPAEQGGQIPAIALTAYAREEDHQQAINSGYQGHVTKPLEPDQLAQTVMTLARQQRLLPNSQ